MHNICEAGKATSAEAIASLPQRCLKNKFCVEIIWGILDGSKEAVYAGLSLAQGIASLRSPLLIAASLVYLLRERKSTMQYQEPQNFKPSEPKWDASPEVKWIPDAGVHSIESPNPFGNDSEAQLFTPKQKKKKTKAADEPKKQNTTKAKANAPQPDGEAKSDGKAKTPFGVEHDQLKQIVGSAQAPEEARADNLAKTVRNESDAAEPDAQKPSAALPSSTDSGPELPGLPKTGGISLPKDKKAQFERKVGNLDDVQVHRTPKAARHLGAEAFTVGRHIYMGEHATDETLRHELGHFHPDDKKTKQIRRKAPNNDWVAMEEQRRRERAARKERQRKAAETAAKHKESTEAKARQQPHQARLLLFTQTEKFKAFKAKAQQQHEQATQARRQARLQKAIQHHPGIRDILKQPPSFFGGALAFGAGAMNPVLSAALVAGSVARSALATNPKVSGRLLNGAQKQGQTIFQGATQFAQAPLPANQSQSKADPVASFQQPLKHNAQTRLQENRTRLDRSQQRFSDPDPKNQNWDELRHQSTVVANLNARTQSATTGLLNVYRKATGDRVSSPFPLLSTATSSEERRQLVMDFYQKQLGPQWKTLAPQMMPLVDRFYVADALRAGMFTQEPALAILTPGEVEGANTPENNLKLKQRITSGFDTTRNSIGRLEKALQTDKNGAVALKFDQVVGQTLSGIEDPKQRQLVLAWVQQQQKIERDRQLQGTLGLAATTVAAVGASAFGVGSLALIFGGAGAVLGGKMAMDGINQAGTNLDAVQAGDTGGQRLTATNPHQAQMDYQMAMVNVGLSLLDAKVAVSSIQQLLSSRQAVQVFKKLKPVQVELFAETTKLQQAGKTAEAKKALQQLKGEVSEGTFKQIEAVWQKLESPAGFGRIEVPRTPGLPKSITLAELRKIRGVPGPQGIILEQKSVSFSEMWKLSEDTGLEYVLTKENEKFILRSGAPSMVRSPKYTRPIAHTHPLDPLGEFDQLPSPADIDALNLLWGQNPNGPRPTSTVIWGPEPGNTTQFGATGIEQLPKKNPHKR